MAIALLGYPFAIYYGLNEWGIETVAIGLGLLFLLRISAGKNIQVKALKHVTWASGVMGLVLIMLAVFLKDGRWFKFYPVVVSLLMLGFFSISLWQKETLIERLARLQDPNLPDSAVSYTRKVTKMWCLFFVINASIAFATIFLPLEYWTLYNGFISYILAGTLLGGEFLVRAYLKRKLQ